MFFRDRIKSIKPADRVLEIGPGGTPYDRSDVFLDLDPTIFKDEEEASYQRGKAAPLQTTKPVIYYDGKKLPFKDNEFDYVICSHVLEHVTDLEAFLSELFRITTRGYIEFPTILYDYIYDIPVNQNFLLFDKKGNTLSFLKKNDTSMSDFSKVQTFFRESLIRGHESLVQSLEQSMIQGFEWSKPFKLIQAKDVDALVPHLGMIKTPNVNKPDITPPIYSPTIAYKPLNEYRVQELVVEISHKMKRRIKRQLRLSRVGDDNRPELVVDKNMRLELEYFLTIQAGGRKNYLDSSITPQEHLFEKLLWWMTESKLKNTNGAVDYWVEEHSRLDVGTHNLSNRELWLEKSLGSIKDGSKILDAGAGELQYKRFCGHLNYVSQDFAQYDGKGDEKGLQTTTWDNSKLDIVSDITSIPVPDNSFDAVMCIEVFEHIPKPIDALAEFSRILKKNGRLIITTPVSSLTHFAPYYFYNGYSRYFFETLLPEFGFKLEELSFNGNYFEYVAQEIRRLDGIATDYSKATKSSPIDKVVRQITLRRLQALSKNDTGSSELLSHGVNVVAVKV